MTNEQLARACWNLMARYGDAAVPLVPGELPSGHFLEDFAVLVETRHGTTEDIHDAWVARHVAVGWRNGPFSEENKTSRMLTPFRSLPPSIARLLRIVHGLVCDVLDGH